MIRVGIVSDTHSKDLPRQMLTDFKNVDLIIHAGDFCEQPDYEVFAKIAKVKAVYGNMDSAAIRRLFPRRQIIEIGNIKIGLFHGEGPPKTIFDSVKSEFANDDVNIVIFGHSHQPTREQVGKVLYFNPGSPNDTIFAPYCSYGMLEIDEKKCSVTHIKVKDIHG